MYQGLDYFSVIIFTLMCKILDKIYSEDSVAEHLKTALSTEMLARASFLSCSSLPLFEDYLSCTQHCSMGIAWSGPFLFPNAFFPAQAH